MLDESQILSLAKIHSRPTGDPAVGRDDVHQDVALALLRRSPEHFGHGWVVARSAARDAAMQAQCRRRRSAVPLSSDMEIACNCRVDDVASVGEVVQMCDRLSRFQRAVVLATLEGSTQQEIASRMGAPLSSVGNALKVAVNVLRERNGLPPVKVLRMGRSRASDDQVIADRRCVVCGGSLSGYRVDATCCRAYACRNRKRQLRLKSEQRRDEC